MRIGIISDPEHCKTHLRELSSEGYDVSCLGARPTNIPPSYDVLVVRVSSVSHGGDAVARTWMKETGNPAIYENGLTGIRRELRRLVLDVAVPQREDFQEKSTQAEVRDDLAACAEAYVEARPGDSRDSLSKALRSVLYEKYPDLAEQCLSIIPAIASAHYSKEEIPMGINTETNVYPNTRGPLPTDKKWTKVISEHRLRNIYDTTKSTFVMMSPDARSCFSELYDKFLLDSDLNLRSLLWESLITRQAFFIKKGYSGTIFDGNPLGFVMFLMLCRPADSVFYKRTFQEFYKSVTNKKLDSRLVDAAAWFLGHPEPAVHNNEVNDTVSEADESSSEVHMATRDVVESNTEAILTLMEDLAEVRKAVDEILNRGNADLSASVEDAFEARIKDLEERITQVQLDALPGAAEHLIESRITALEGCLDSVKGQVPSLVSEAEHRLRSDLSDALDSAKNPVSGEMFHNPATAVENFKSALKAAGFTGTLNLTLTIE